jgi:hypothetical protein
MKRTTITLAALLAALVPAAGGLWGNASFSQAVPVRVPASAQVVTPTVPSPATATADDHGGDTPRDQRTEPGDDRDDRSTTSTGVPSGTRTTEAGDDHGGDTPRDERTEPGDDRDSGSGGSDSSGPGSGGSDSSGPGSGGSGSGTSGSGESGADDHGGHGSDD